MSEPVRVLIADDHQMVRFGLRALISTMPGMEICGEAATGRDAVERAKELKPDILITDISMPELNGLDVITAVRKFCPDTECLVFTGHETDKLIREVFAAGARSYILKSDAKEHLEAAIRSLAAHKPYFTTTIGEVLFARFLGERKGETQAGDEARLTEREREIVQLLTEGHANKEVASVLGISIKTVETHRAAIMKKLKLDSFSDLVRYAIRNHIISA